MKSPPGQQFIDAARKVLLREKRPMTCGQIVRAAKSLIKTEGQTPDRTLYSILTRRIAKYGAASGFKRTGPGLFDLSEPTDRKPSR